MLNTYILIIIDARFIAISSGIPSTDYIYFMSFHNFRFLLENAPKYFLNFDKIKMYKNQEIKLF